MTLGILDSVGGLRLECVVVVVGVDGRLRYCWMLDVEEVKAVWSLDKKPRRPGLGGQNPGFVVHRAGSAK